MAYTARFGTGENQDSTGRVVTYDYKEPAYAATISVTPNASVTYVNVAQLTGALTLNTVVTNCKVADRLTLIFKSDGTNRTVTLGTGLTSSAATIVVTASKNASVSYVFNGVAFVEIGRAVTV